jgi:predicted MFS family arabinose efflux permease
VLANIVATNYEAASASEETRKWWTLAAVAFGLFMIMLDNTVVNVALPAMARDLGVGLSELEWIVTGYALSAPRVPAVPEAA